MCYDGIWIFQVTHLHSAQEEVNGEMMRSRTLRVGYRVVIPWSQGHDFAKKLVAHDISSINIYAAAGARADSVGTHGLEKGSSPRKA
jgi:hypothetical protein